VSNRREFFKKFAGILAGLNFPNISMASSSFKQSDRWSKILPQRILGNTGKKVTMLGVGGAHIGWIKERDAQEIIESAIKGGVRFFDSAEGYGDGESERRLGKYLTPKYRSEIFLMTKTEQKTAIDIKKSLDKSLKRLNTDYLDLWQVHTLESIGDVDERITGGILDAMIDAKVSGKVHHIGFTGHATPKTHVKMLEKTDIFETCQMPINICDSSYKSFILDVMPILLERKMGILAMKVLGEGSFFKRIDGQLLIPEMFTLKEALYFAWSLPISVLITGADNASMLEEKITLARSFEVMNEELQKRLIHKMRDIAEKGKFEDYKYGDY
jgi:aryl-alcohol dehydrogenase-like predicted oxidoreductase